MRRSFRVLLLVILGVGLLLSAVLLIAGVILQKRSFDRETHTAEQLAPANGRFIDVNGTKIFIQEQGSRSSSAIVFIHGTGSWSEVWQPTMKLLASKGLYSVAIDLPPFGFSSAPAAGYSRQVAGSLITGVIQSLGLKNVVLVGHSFGGRATLTSAKEIGSSLRALVLVDIAVGWPTSETAAATKPSSLVKFIADRRLLMESISALATEPSLSKKLLEGFIADPIDATDEVVAIYRKPLLVKGKSVQTAEWIKEFVSTDDYELAESQNFYSTFTIPTLIIWGNLDTITPLWQAERLKKWIPGSQLKIMNGVGHIPYIEERATFDQALYLFLAENVAHFVSLSGSSTPEINR